MADESWTILSKSLTFTSQVVSDRTHFFTALPTFASTEATAPVSRPVVELDPGLAMPRTLLLSSLVKARDAPRYEYTLWNRRLPVSDQFPLHTRLRRDLGRNPGPRCEETGRGYPYLFPIPPSGRAHLHP